MTAGTLILWSVTTAIGVREASKDGFHHGWTADADIVGDGVRAATWAQGSLLFLITFLGMFHFGHSAAKEIGGGLVILHVSLALAFLGPLKHRTLSPVDAVLGSMILEVQNSALSVQLVSKETLAARWQVGAVLFAQLLGLSTVGVLVRSFTRGGTAGADQDSCISIIWWVWLSNCSDVPPSQISPFWIYYGLRWITFAHSSFYSVTRADFFDKSLKWEQRHHYSNCAACDDPFMVDTAMCTSCIAFQAPPRRREIKDLTNIYMDTRSAFSEITATTELFYLEYAAYGLLGFMIVEIAMASNSVSKTSPVYAVGQVSQVVVAGVTLARAVWVTTRSLVRDGGEYS
ncbi:uncharacterized protein DNG_03509 [Cephalotrichum gorgonifer]|uniref:Uncharacterized protein n=1 Tax=Cephalotrichum gorgonifer TaxID=2041049 RepID=A0AAE8STN2_9PEZI|nr:uncharacterized protein DNG_03509 [Cephalotrichum gorgonifer]